MTHSRTTLLALVMVAFAAPAMAGGFTFDLPRLTFPEPTPPTVGQACTDLGTNPSCDDAQ